VNHAFKSVLGYLLAVVLIGLPALAQASQIKLPFEISIGDDVRSSAEGDAPQAVELQVNVNWTGEREALGLSWSLKPLAPEPGPDLEIGNQDLPADAPGTAEIIVPVPGGGVYLLSVLAQGLKPGLGYSDRALMLLVAFADGSVRLLDPTSDRAHEFFTTGQLSIDGEAFLAPMVADESGAVVDPARAPEDTDHTSVYGTIKLTSASGSEHTFKNVMVEIWDEDPISSDDLLGVGYTDDDGNYAINVVNDDGWGGGGIDIYIKIKTDNFNRFSVLNTANTSPYVWTSTVHDNVTAATFEIDMTTAFGNGASSVWRSMDIAYKVGKRGFVGALPDYIPVYFPGDGTYFSPSSHLIAIQLEYSDGPNVVAHEYGHALMYQLYGGQMPANSGGVHYICSEHTTGLSWSEGFATAFALIAAGSQDGVFHYNKGDAGLNIEHYSCTLRDMAIDEARVAAALWDLYDDKNDNNGGSQDKGRNGEQDANQGGELVDLRTLFAGVYGPVQHDIYEFWTSLQDVMTPTQNSAAPAIMDYNWYVPPPAAPDTE
jgi:hypothetical protein